MRTQISLCDYIDNIYITNSNCADNSNERLKFKKFLDNAFEKGLTENQKKILTMYFIKEMPMTEIAAILGKNKSTVSRTIKTSKQKLCQLSNICFF